MNLFTLEQRWIILEIYFQNKDNWEEIARICESKLGHNEAPTAPDIREFINKVRETGFIVDAPTHQRAPTLRTPENIHAVAASARENPSTSTRYRSPFTLEQRWIILEIYFQNKGNWTKIARKCGSKLGRSEAPTAPGIRKFINKARATGFIVDAPTRQRARTLCTPELIEAVAASVRENPSTSTRHRSQELNISRTTLRRILQNDLNMTPSKVQLVPELKPRDQAFE